MNEIIRKFLLARNKFMSEMNLRQSGITYNACEPFTKNNKKIRKCKGTGDSRSIQQNKIEKGCFQHGISCGDFKNFPERTASDKVLFDKAFIIAKNPKYNGVQIGYIGLQIIR